MRPAPPLSIATRVAPAWRLGVLVLCAAAAVVIGLWLWQLPAMPYPGAGWLLGTTAFGILVTAASSAAGRAVRLRWDGRDWYLGRDGHEQPGALVLCLDLGGGWLLRFQPLGRPAPWRAIWLPLTEDALGAQAHALRCALYSPRLPAGIPGQPPATDV